MWVICVGNMGWLCNGGTVELFIELLPNGVFLHIVYRFQKMLSQEMLSQYDRLIIGLIEHR